VSVYVCLHVSNKQYGCLTHFFFMTRHTPAQPRHPKAN
jgi:hypothetical protein